MNIVEKVWGHEDILYNGALYAAKNLCVKKGGTSSIHFHPRKTESFIVMEGKVIVRLYDGLKCSYETTRDPGDAPLDIPPGTAHSFASPWEDSVILEVSTSDDPEDCVRLNASSYHP